MLTLVNFIVMKKRQYAYQFRCQLTKEQTVQFVQSAGCVRKVWNYFLSKIEKAEERYKTKLKAETEQAKLNLEVVEKNTSFLDKEIDNKESQEDKDETKTKAKSKKASSYKGYHHYAKLLTKLKAKKKYFYLKDCPSQALQQTLINLDKGFKRFFKKEAEHPVFKKKAKYKAIHFPQGFDFKGEGQINLPKIGLVHFIQHRPLHPDFTIKNVYIREKAGHFYLSLQGEISEPDLVKRHSLRKVIGFDLGITHFLVSNKKDYVTPLNKYQQLKHLQALQKGLKAKTKFSTNWTRLQQRIAKKHHHIANCRKNFNHQLSRYLANHYDIVFLEKLDIQAMLTKGSCNLNLQILDQGWYQFKTFLKYKLGWQSKKMIEVDPAYTSQGCSYCGHISRANRQSQSQFCCVKCGFATHADYQASLNIFKRGLPQLDKEERSVILKDLFCQASYHLVSNSNPIEFIVQQDKKKALTRLLIPHLGNS